MPDIAVSARNVVHGLTHVASLSRRQFPSAERGKVSVEVAFYYGNDLVFHLFAPVV